MTSWVACIFHQETHGRDSHSWSSCDARLAFRDVITLAAQLIHKGLHKDESLILSFLLHF